MKRIHPSFSVPLFVVVLFTVGCDDSELVSPYSNNLPKQGFKILNAIEQIRGYVKYSDGHPPSGTPEIYCYFDGDLKQTDLIDDNGLYHFTGPHPDWPTGTYHVKTQIIWKKGQRYKGEIFVDHEFGTPNLDEDIELLAIESK